MKPQIKVVGRIMLGFVLIMCVVADLGHAQTTTRVSVSSAGGEGDDQSFDPSLSADGRFVAFASRSTNLVPGDTNFSRDIFVHDRQTGQTSRVSVSSTGQQADNASFDPQLSADGRFVAFWSYAKNLVVGDTNGREDFFVHDRQTGQTSRVNVSSTGAEAGQPTKITGFIGVALSADGRFVAFDSCSTNLVLGDTNAQCDIFVHDRQTGQTTRVSVSSTGEQANGDSTRPQLSTDGQFVAFISEASNLVATDMNNDWDVFVHDRQTGQTTRVSVTSTGAESSGVGSPDARISLSGDGRVVAFDACGSNLFPADPNGGCDIFAHDRQTGQTSWVSVSSTGEPANDNSFFPQLSADGRFVTFNSLASNLVSGDTNATIFSLDFDTFVHDRQTGQTTRVSVSSAGVQAAPSDCECSEPAINGDGRVIAFTSNASNLVPGDTNTAGQFSEGGDIFVHAIPPPNVIPVGIGDLDGNGTADVVWRDTTTGTVSVWFMNGLDVSSSAVLDTIPADWVIGGIGDLDGNGTADVVWSHPTTGIVAAWYMTPGTGAVGSSAVLATGLPADWIITGMGDLDGNGTVDVVWRHVPSGLVAAWYMTPGTGAVGTSAVLDTIPPDWVIGGVGDLDGNGTADVVWRHPSSGTVAAWYMTPGTGAVGSSAVLATGLPGDWIIGGIGDLDNNGTADVVWRHVPSGLVAAWLMTSGTGAVGTSDVIATIPPDWIIAGMGDLNLGNGPADVVWHHPSSETAAAWLMIGLNVDDSGIIAE